MLELKAESRQELGAKVNRQRKAGKIPAIVYGHDVKSQLLFVDGKEFVKIYKEAGESSLIGLELDGKKKNVLIHDVQRDAMSGEFLHVDFYQVRMDEKLKATVPLEFIGESEAVKTHGGMLMKTIQEVEVEALPQNLPHHIEADISSLATFEDRITIGDLQVADGVKILADSEDVVASVAPPRSEEEQAALEGKIAAPVEEVKVVGEEEKKTAEAAAEGEPKEAAK